MMDPAIGGGVAPGRRGGSIRQTEVRRVPYWVPWDQGGRGAWRLVPKDTVHGAQLIDENNQAHDLYESKGFIPQRYAPSSALPKLVELAQGAIERQASIGAPPPAWASGVLAQYPEMVQQAEKVPAGADAA